MAADVLQFSISWGRGWVTTPRVLGQNSRGLLLPMTSWFIRSNIIIHLGPGSHLQTALCGWRWWGEEKLSFLTPQGNSGKLVGNLVFTVTVEDNSTVLFRAGPAILTSCRAGGQSHTKGEVATVPSVIKHWMTSRVFPGPSKSMML